MNAYIAVSQAEINSELIGSAQQGVTWGVKVSLGGAAVLCAAFVVGFVIRKLI